MGVTQVLRGDDHLTNTPRQIMVLDALGMRRPAYGHVGLLVGEDGAPLSKRHGSTSVHEFRERGFLSIAMLNHLFRLGHASDVDGWLPAADMPAHFRPRASGPRAGAFRGVAIDALAEGDAGAACRPRKSARGWDRDDSTEFIELVRHNVVLPADAVPWRGVVQRRARAAGRGGTARHRGRGRGFLCRGRERLRAIRAAISKCSPRILKERTGRKGAGSVHAAAGGADRAGARSGARAAAETHVAGDGAAPARSPMLKIHNSLTGEKEEFKPLRANEVRMYVCGMTNYDYIHVGHARMLTVFDLVQRYLRSLGYKVTYVRNVTDIDDKIIERAAANGENWADLARRFTAAMHEDCATLGLQTPDLEPRATEYIAPIIAMIQTLIDKGYAYAARRMAMSCTRCASSPDYGRLSGKKIDDLRAGSRVQVDEAKQDPLDFVLWKHAKPGEPSWPSPWGAGPAGLAHRMLGHVDQPARELFRSARRGRGFEVSAP